MFRALLSLSIIGTALASPTALLPRQVPPPVDGSSSISCLSLRNSCNATTVDLNNFYNYTSCIMLTTCMQGVENPPQVLSERGAPATQPRLTQTAFNSMTGGNPDMSQQNYIDAYYHAISVTPNGTYPDNVQYIIDQWQTIAAWTGFCSTGNIPYSNLADWFEYSATPGTCPAVASCNATIAASAPACVPQPITDNGSCSEMVAQCQLWVTQGLFQNEYCVLASFCFAWSNTDVLIRNEYPSYVSSIPTSATEQRLSESVFYNMTGGAQTMSQQNAIDAYYAGLTGTWTSLGGPFGAETPSKTNSDGPYPTSPDYVIAFWAIISAWTGFCETREIPYSNLADYLSYAAGSGYHPTC
ncbi:hypothetical protein HYDPIDRAFT_116633 [Hydnomerulius pinastri MD-312]|uniref:Uncharacterized protein n=1 Tax=Hydnomerulius pinastri MD-312 TaxID=994086 RepID=A0A0C9WB69_9AGAM|nr:hypothetical protein HYDPIDRAFT_116633 [Hydnomerulius pinastri MD-312]